MPFMTSASKDPSNTLTKLEKERESVCVCVRACVHACVCVCIYIHIYITDKLLPEETLSVRSLSKEMKLTRD